MIISKYNKTLYKGNINIDFYLYCLKKDFKLIKYLFINIFFYLLTFISKRFENKCKENKFKYLSKVKDLNKTIKEFYKKKNRLNENIEDKIDLIIDDIPEILIPKELSKKVIAYELDKNYKINLKKYEEEIKNLKSDKLYIHGIFDLENIDSKKIIRVTRKSLHYYKKRPKWLKLFNYAVVLFAITYLLTCVSFIYTNTATDLNWLQRFFEQKIFMLNLLPILLCILIFLFITKRLHVSFSITSIILLVLGISSQTKLLYRDDVVKMSDLTLIKEAAIMTERYDIVIKNATILAIFLFIVLFFIIKKYIPKLKFNIKKQLITIVVTIILSLISINKILLNEEIYNSVGDTTGINIWISTRQSQIRGLVYPFINSINEIVNTKPEGYNEEEVEKILNKYNYTTMKENQKVNVIAVMLEAYQDMSKFDVIDFDEDIYKPFHEIQKNSISGELVTSIFGGGTIVTERNFLTGFYDLPNFRKLTNSYVWYFKEQGYRTEAMHPIYGAFYNRNTANLNMGFDFYYNYENTFASLEENRLTSDQVLFEKIIDNYEKNKKNKKPYFNFSVTYQNHGPYISNNYENKEFFFKNKEYDENAYNNLNEYFSGIKKTNKSLEYLINYFDNEDEPTIVVLFGDHNPYFDGGWDELEINMDMSTNEGIYNYYSTPYIIHANNSAKNIFKKDFVGKGEKMSPMFLMSYLFEYCGIKGNEWNQYLRDFNKETNIINSYLYTKNNEVIRVKNNEYSEKIKEYNKINYYMIDNYKNKR